MYKLSSCLFNVWSWKICLERLSSPLPRTLLLYLTENRDQLSSFDPRFFSNSTERYKQKVIWQMSRLTAYIHTYVYICAFLWSAPVGFPQASYISVLCHNIATDSRCLRLSQRSNRWKCTYVFCLQTFHKCFLSEWTQQQPHRTDCTSVFSWCTSV